MSTYHMIVWLDHQSANVYGVTHNDVQEIAQVRARDSGHGHVHHHAGTPGAGHNAVSPAFLRETALLLKDAKRILIVGPGDAKQAMRKFIETEMPLLAACIAGVEPMGRPGHGELRDFARLFFHQDDLMGSGKHA
jgi:stalled ribosome rescue protein Dom34